MTDLETIWETHDFVLGEIVILEDEYNFLLAELPLKLSLFDEGILEKKVLQSFIDKSIETYNGLKSFYDKHILTIKELREACSSFDEKVPEHRKVTFQSLAELESVTSQLRGTIIESRKVLDYIKEEKGLK